MKFSMMLVSAGTVFCMQLMASHTDDTASVSSHVTSLTYNSSEGEIIEFIDEVMVNEVHFISRDEIKKCFDVTKLYDFDHTTGIVDSLFRENGSIDLSDLYEEVESAYHVYYRRAAFGTDTNLFEAIRLLSNRIKPNLYQALLKNYPNYFADLQMNQCVGQPITDDDIDGEYQRIVLMCDQLEA